MRALPTWLWIVIGVAGLLAAPLAFLGLPGDPVDRDLSPRDSDRIENVVHLIRQGKMQEARARVESRLEEPFPPEALPRFLDALRIRHGEAVTREGLYLYGELLARMVREQVATQEFDFHLRRLRQQTLLAGGKELLSEVLDRVMRSETLLEYTPALRLDAVDHAVFFERWDEALTAFRSVPRAAFGDLRTPIEATYMPVRTLVRIASSGRDPEAREELQELLADLDELVFGENDERRARVASWLRGLERLFAPGSDLDRGSALLEKAVDPLDLGPLQVAMRLDLAAALREEANRRAERLVEERLPTTASASGAGDPGLAGRRVRQLYRIGWGAVRLGDRDELEEIIAALGEASAEREAASCRELLLGAQELLLGAELQGRARIAAELDGEASSIFPPTELAAWGQIAATGDLPAGDTGSILFETGKIWGELPERRHWIERTLERLRTRIASARDRGYYRYLKALDDFRHDRLDAVREGLLAILEEGPPAGLTRGEISWLLVFAENRAEVRAGIESRRERALEMLEEVIEVEAQGRTESLLAQLMTLQIRLDRQGIAFLETDAGRQLVDGIRGGLAAPWLSFPLTERWLLLEEQFLSLANGAALASDDAGALAALEQLRSFGRDLPAYRALEARARRGIAERTARETPDDLELVRRRWLDSGEAFLEASMGSFGNNEALFDAAEGFLAAGDAIRAAETLDAYVARRSRGQDEKRYWQTLVYRSRILRGLGSIPEALSLIERALDEDGVEATRHDLLLERGLCREVLGETDSALADYQAIYDELSPTSRTWLGALHRKASILQARAEKRSPEEGSDEGSLRAALATWEELAARMATEPRDSRLAEALFRAGEARIVGGEAGVARERFAALTDAAERNRRHRLAPEERRRWNDFAEKGIFGLGDSWFRQNRYADAERIYTRAVEEYPGSALMPWGHHQLGECAVRLGRVDEAIRRFELGIRRVEELSTESLGKLPLNRGREFWIRNFEEKIRLLEKSRTKGNR